MAHRELRVFGVLAATVGCAAIFSGIAGQDADGGSVVTGAEMSDSPRAILSSQDVTYGDRRAPRTSSSSTVMLQKLGDGATIEPLLGETSFSWQYGTGHYGSDWVLSKDSQQVERFALNGMYDTVRINNSALASGSYTWCVSTVDARNNQSGESCRSFTRAVVHKGALTSVRWRQGSDGTFAGQVASSTGNVRVQVVVKQRNRTVSKSPWISVRTPRPGSPYDFSYRARMSADGSARITATVTVAGAGVTQKFSNRLS